MKERTIDGITTYFYSGGWRTKEGVEKRKEQERKRAADRRKKDPQKARERNREYHHKNKEKVHAKQKRYYEENKVRENERRKIWAQKNREKQREINRRNYHAKRDENLSKIKKRRRKLNPTIGLKALSDAFKRGELGVSGVIEQFRKSDGEISRQLDEQTKYRSNASTPDDGSGSIIGEPKESIKD